MGSESSAQLRDATYSDHTPVILLISHSNTVVACASFLQERLHSRVVSTKTLEEGREQLKSDDFSAVVLDEWECDLAPGQTEHLLQFLKDAIPVFVDFSITSAERLSRTVKAALSRREREIQLAREYETARLVQELGDDLTALLLLCSIPLELGSAGRTANDVLDDVEKAAARIAGKIDFNRAAKAAHV